LRKRLVGFDAVGWLKRGLATVGALAVASFCLTATAEAETRTLKLYNTHTKERVSITFKRNGRYIPSGLREANRFLRDWRRNESIKMDPELLDLVWEVYRKVGARDYIYVVSSYRSPATNNMLRKRSRGVARNSQHTLGKAMDFYIPGVNLAKLRATGLRKQVGGVGYYPRSGSPFVHMDTGRVRHWPKMSRSQLAKIFPNGKTLHIPSDGKPLSGYKVALAESKSKNSRSSRPTIVASNNRAAPSTRNQNLRNPGRPTDPSAPVPVTGNSNSSGGGNLFASLFGGGNARDSETTRPGAVGNRPPANLTARVSPVVDNPPVPARKVLATEPEAPIAAPTVVASAAPDLKPQGETPTIVASAAPAVAAAPAPPPNTLDAQRVALETGQQPALSNQTIDSRFQIARAPAQKPDTGLSEAARIAAATLGQTGGVPIPAAAPANDPVAAIAAATGTTVPSPTPAPAPRTGTTLAYASATATPPSLSRSLRPSVSPQQRPEREASASQSSERPTVSGRIPRNQIVDPLAGFASLPDKSEPTLLSGVGTTRHKAFAWLSHPNQRALKNVMKPGNRFVAASFKAEPNSGLRTDRFDGGPAVIVLPVRFAR